jgi:hypothetical protein
MAKARRSYGTGSLYVHAGKTGRRSWYARWYSGGKRARRAIGPKREPGSPDGLTRAEAEAELRRLMHDAQAVQDRASLTVAVVGERLLRHLEIVGRKPTTLATYRSALETHLLPALGTLPLIEVEAGHVENLMTAMQESGKAAKTRANALVLLHQLFHFAERNGWCTDNPCTRVDRPQVEPTLDIRFLNEEEFQGAPRGRRRCAGAAWSRRSSDVPDRDDDRPATGGATCAPLARCRLASGENSRSP